MEIWRRDLGKWVWEVCKKVWRGEGWPEEWKEGNHRTNNKKGEGEKLSDYRVTLMPTLYKICTTILIERIREEVEEKKIIPENQTGFRKGKGIIDNIYVLNYLVQK